MAMAGRGFIHDKLEIKFLILYIAARVIEPIPFETILDLTMCDDAIDYFDFSECLADLVRTEHLTLSQEGQYAITEKGLRNSRICETSLPYSVRLRCDRNLSACNRKLRRKSQVRASSTRQKAQWDLQRLSLALDGRHGQRDGAESHGGAGGYGAAAGGSVPQESGADLQPDHQPAALRRAGGIKARNSLYGTSAVPCTPIQGRAFFPSI
jgi:hypothetical protein